MAKTVGKATDVAQPMIATVWNIAIAGGGILLETFGEATALAVALVIAD